MAARVARFFLLLFVVVLSSGCVSVRPINLGPSQTAHVYEKNYEVGTVKTAYVGQEMVKVRDFYVEKQEQNRIRSNSDFTISVMGQGRYRASKGEEFPLLGEIDEVEGTQYLVSFPGMYDVRFCINRDGSISDRIIGHINQKLALSPTVTPAGATFAFVTSEKTDTSKGYTNFELVFTGISDRTINLLYREYTPAEQARSAFYQNLTYPLESKVIRFKEIIIDVQKVAADRIDFAVRRDDLSDTRGTSRVGGL